MKVDNPAGGRYMRHCLLLTALMLASSAQVAKAQTTLPNDPKPNNPADCIISQIDFNDWFESGTATKDGIVRPADSISFNPTSFCSFYRWSEQMFLWLTSPVPSRYGSGSHVFDSPVFFSLSPLDATKHRTLIPHSPGGIFNLNVALTQRGSNGQRVVFDSTGKIHDVVTAEAGPTGKLLIRNAVGQPVEVERIEAGADGKARLLDRQNKPIELQAARGKAPELRDRLGAVHPLQDRAVLVNGIPHILTGSGAVVDTEQGQSGGEVLMAQNNSLVYYLLQVNDVWAYFNTGVTDNKFTPQFSQFPTTGQDLGRITTVAQQAPSPFTKPSFPDGNALAVEVKSAWIETSGLAHPGDYITITATIPTFNPPLTQSGLTQSTVSGSKQATLALMGMHVVGTVSGHPEMIWATFEHVNNAPNAPYTYNNANGTVPGPAPGLGPWNFSATGATSGSITKRMDWDPQSNSITTQNTGSTIGPNDVYRVNAWGTASSDLAFANNNTDIISINNSVLGQLLAGDKRRKYILTGTTWTVGGQPPIANNQVGTPQMANTTMETFMQPSNCFSCHRGNMLGSQPSGAFGGGLSHVWQPTKPLF
jgi:hypothetical protein